jgi:hypothetical protein
MSSLTLQQLAKWGGQRATAGYFYDTFAYEICFYWIYFNRISFSGIYFYKALKFLSFDCTDVRNT